MKKEALKLIGEKFGRLTVESRFGTNKRKRATWKCLCDCGNYVVAESNNLVSGNTRSCGCLKNDIHRDRMLKHGYRHHPLYKTWQNMKCRCGNKNSNSYKNYGERGIVVCDEWKNDFVSFKNWAISNGYKEQNCALNTECTIDRINYNGNYEPNNCRFTNIKNQSKNKRNTIMIMYNNEKKPLVDWCMILGLDLKRTYQRIYNLGWEAKMALETPICVKTRWSKKEDDTIVSNHNKSIKNIAYLLGRSENSVRGRIRRISLKTE